MKLSKHQSLPLSSSSSKLEPKITKITNLLCKAIDEVHKNVTRSALSMNSSPSKRKSNDSSEAQSINEVLQNLKKGYLVTKHSQSTRKKSDKFVYISSDYRYLCWKSPDKQDAKRIELIEISNVIKEGSQFSLKATKVKQLQNCIYIKSEQKNLQLECVSQIQAQYLRYQLIRAIRNSRNLKFNYKYLKD